MNMNASHTGPVANASAVKKQRALPPDGTGGGGSRAGAGFPSTQAQAGLRLMMSGPPSKIGRRVLSVRSLLVP